MRAGLHFVSSFVLVVVICLGNFGCDSGELPIAIDLKPRLSEEDLRAIRVQQDPKALIFGFDLRSTPQEDARQLIPLLRYLETVTGYKFELRFTPEKSSIVDELGNGIVHFAAVGAGSYLAARQKYGVIPVVRGLNAQGKAEYQSVIVVRSNSSIRQVQDLCGKSFAFGSLTSTQGHIIPRIVLAEHSLGLEDLARYSFTGSHRNCADAVIAGRFNAGGLQDQIGREMAKSGYLRVIYISKYYPSSGIAANKDVQPRALSEIKKALLEFRPKGRDSAGLYRWDRTEMPNGFIEARDEDYATLRNWSRKFGLLDGGRKDR